MLVGGGVKKIDRGHAMWLTRKRREAYRKRYLVRRSARRVPSTALTLKLKELTLFTSKGHAAVAKCVRRMRRGIKDGRRVVIDMTECTNVTACGALRLHAEMILGREDSAAGVLGVRFKLPKNNLYRHFLDTMGFGLPEDAEVKPKAGVLRIQSGAKKVPGQLAQLLNQMNERLFKSELERGGEDWDSLYKALSEAMLNVSVHAYKDDERVEFVQRLGERWWLMGNRIKKQLYLAIYDKGIGIPRSFQKKGLEIVETMKKLVAWLPGAEGGGDSSLIRMAMEYGRSGLKQAGNGLGLDDIKKYVENNPDGKLHVFSNHGRVVFHSKDSTYKLIEYADSIHGTLIQWNLKLELPAEGKADET